MVKGAPTNITRLDLIAMIQNAYAHFNNHFRVQVGAEETQQAVLNALSVHDGAMANTLYVRLININGINGSGGPTSCTSPYVLFNASYVVGPPNFSKVVTGRTTYCCVAAAFVPIPNANLPGVDLTQTALLVSTNIPNNMDAKLPAEESENNPAPLLFDNAIKQFRWETVGSSNGSNRPQQVPIGARHINWNADYNERKWNFTSIRVAIGTTIVFYVSDNKPHGVYLAPQSSTIIIPSTANGYATNFKCGDPSKEEDACYYWQNWEIPAGSSARTKYHVQATFCFAGCYVVYDPYFPGTTLTINVIAAEVANQKVVNAGNFTPVVGKLAQSQPQGFYPVVCSSTYPFASTIPVNYTHFEGELALTCCLPKGPNCTKTGYCNQDGFTLPACSTLQSPPPGTGNPCNGANCSGCAGSSGSSCGASSLFVPEPTCNTGGGAQTGMSMAAAPSRGCTSCGGSALGALGGSSNVLPVPQGSFVNSSLTDAQRTVRVTNGEFFNVPSGTKLESSTHVYLITPSGYGVAAIIDQVNGNQYRIRDTSRKFITPGLTYTITNSSTGGAGNSLIGLKFQF